MHYRKRFTGTVVCGCAVAILGSDRAMAQEALRSALESDASAELRSRPAVPPPGDVLRWGAATFDISVGYSLEATDNATFERTHGRFDLIQRPIISFGMLYQVSPRSRLDFRTGFGYEDYIKNTVEDRFFILPGSELALDIHMRNGVVTPFDRFEYNQDVAQEGALSGVGSFPRFENTVGVRTAWQFDKRVYYASYSHLNVFITGDTSGATAEDFDYLERADEQFFGRAGYLFNAPVQAGVEGTVSLSDYVLETQRDRDTFSAGPYITWTAADALEITLRGGVVYTYYHDAEVGGLEATDYTTYYAGIDLDHRLTDYTTYGFSVTHDIRGGVNAGTDYIETTRVDFDLSWRMTPRWTWTPDIFFENGKEVSFSSTGFSEDYRRFGISIGPLYQVTRHLSCFARYAFNLRDSDIEERSYHENRGTIGVTYRF